MKIHTATTGKTPNRKNCASSEGWRQFLTEPAVLLLAAAFLMGMTALWWQTARLQRQLAETVAIEQARSYALALQEVRDVYTLEVSARAKTMGADSPGNQKKPVNLLPAFSVLLTHSGNQRANIKERFYSLESLNRQNSGSDTPDEFIRSAWASLAQSPHHERTRFEEIQGRPMLRYATGWQEGAGKGILEILAPLDNILMASGVYGKILFSCFAGLSVLGVCLVGLMLGKSRRAAKAASLQALALESEGIEQEKIIRVYEQERQERQRQEEEILPAVDILVEVTKDLQKTTSELASGAAEMAAAVNETTATVEEVKQTAALSSQKAHHVSASAQKAA